MASESSAVDTPKKASKRAAEESSSDAPKVKRSKKSKKDKKEKKEKKEKKTTKKDKGFSKGDGDDSTPPLAASSAPKRSHDQTPTPADERTEKIDSKPKFHSDASGEGGEGDGEGGGLSRKERRQKFWDLKHGKKKKSEEADVEADAAAADTTSAAAGAKSTDATAGTSPKPASEDKAPTKKKKSRYLLFVGNLSYSTTMEHMYTHFGKFAGLIDVRLLSDKKTGASKGIAFIEYDNVASHGKALALHHSKLSGREINVEFTVGGGGKSSARMTKLAAKNSSRPKPTDRPPSASAGGAIKRNQSRNVASSKAEPLLMA